jgi:hypothetical protein
MTEPHLIVRLDVGGRLTVEVVGELDDVDRALLESLEVVAADLPAALEEVGALAGGR